MSSTRDKIIGGFKLMLLFRSGVNKFTGTREEALRSIAVPFLVYAASYAVPGDIYPPKGMETGYSGSQIIGTMVAHFILSFILGTLLVAFLAYLLERKDRFWLYFSASNWTTVPIFIVTFPLYWMAIKGIVPRAPMDRVFAIMSLYTYCVSGCIAYGALRINWMLAGAIAVAIMFVQQELWHVLYIAQGIPIPW